MRLETERLILREFVPDDEATWLAIHADAEYRRHYPADDLVESKLVSLLASFVAWQSEQPRVRWQMALEVRGRRELIGTCGVRLPEAEASWAEMGYGLSAKHWGRGLATEAARRMARFAFEDLGLHRLSSRTSASNVRSQAVLGRLGMTLEGRLREYEMHRGEWQDALLYGLLRSEWEAAQR